MPVAPAFMPRTAAWNLPDSPWILHAGLVMFADIDDFVDVQAQSTVRFDARLLGLRVLGDGPRTPHWIAAEDTRRDYLAYRAALATGRGSTWLRRRLRDRPPVVLHAHYGTIAARLTHLARHLEVPLVGSFYGYDTSLTSLVESRRWRARYRRLFHAGSAFLVEGPALAAKVEALGCDPAKLHLIRLPANEIGLARCRRAAPDRFVVSAAGRFVEKKGFDTAIKAFARGLHDKPDAELVLVGGGELDDALHRLARDEGVEERVTWYGKLPFETYTNTAAAASLAIFPSRRAANGDAEGGGLMTLIELQWLGVPSIVSDHDDLPYTAAPELPVLPPTDVDAWAETLRHYYDHPGELDALGEAGRRFVHEHHTIAQNVAAREDVYTSLIRSRS